MLCVVDQLDRNQHLSLPQCSLSIAKLNMLVTQRISAQYINMEDLCRFLNNLFGENHYKVTVRDPMTPGLHVQHH